MDRIKHFEEWFKQAKYDIDTAWAMFEKGRYIYCVFMCHLSVEKALKALYAKVLNENPPKIHSLVYLAQRTEIKLPQKIKDFLENLDKVSVPTRYPEELEKLIKEYGKGRTRIVFTKSKEALKCLEKELKK